MKEILEKYYNDGLLIKQVHPTKDLTIWNYSRKVQYERLWDDVTTKCRGLVTNNQGVIVSRCFKKFFNYEELESSEIPKESFEITEKMDGQLGLLFWYDGEWIFVSRGSFTSIYAEKGRQLLEKYDYKRMSHWNTYIFEIIFKEGRIVCKYDYEDLILIGCINIPFGFEISIHDEWFENPAGFKIVKKYDGINDFKVLKEMVDNDAEGYVVRFRSGLRMKIKGTEYCRLHSLITKISARDIWKYVKEGRPLDDLLQSVPDEFDAWIKKKEKEFQNQFIAWKRAALIIYQSDIMPTEGLTRKEIAEKILKHSNDFRAILFKIYDEKDFSDIIWDKLYPPYEKPFNKNDEEGDN